MEKKSKNVKRIAGLAWLLAAFLFTMATVAAQAHDKTAIESSQELGMGVLVGGPIRPPH